MRRRRRCRSGRGCSAISSASASRRSPTRRSIRTAKSSVMSLTHDARRRTAASSTSSRRGRRGSCCARRFSSRRDLEQLRASPALQPVTIDIVFPASRRRRGVRRPAAGDRRRGVRRGRARQRARDPHRSRGRAPTRRRCRRCWRRRRCITRWSTAACACAPASSSKPARRATRISSACCSATARRRCARRSATTRLPRWPSADPTGCDVARDALPPGARARAADADVEDGRLHVQWLLRRAAVRDPRPRRVAGRSLLPRHGLAGRRRDAGGHRRDGARRATSARSRDAAPAAEYPGLHGVPPRRRVSRDQPGDRARPAEGARRSAKPPADTGAPAYETFKSHVYGPPAAGDSRPARADARRPRRRRRSTRSNRSRRSAAASSPRRCRSARCRPKRTARSRSR